MPALRQLLTGAGFENVQTHVQSGNVVLDSELDSDQLARECERLIKAEFGFDVDVLVRTGDELAAIVERDPLKDIVTEPRFYHVHFLSREPDADVTQKLTEVAADGEQVVAVGREQYVWLPRGAGRSKLWAAIARPRAGIVGTARNWRTVTALLDL
jgi:uncharacterized protein (DUF1697 family)